MESWHQALHEVLEANTEEQCGSYRVRLKDSVKIICVFVLREEAVVPEHALLRQLYDQKKNLDLGPTLKDEGLTVFHGVRCIA